MGRKTAAYGSRDKRTRDFKKSGKYCIILMKTHMDTATLTTKVQTSQLLSEADRTYWLGNIPRMTELQLKKLEAILNEASDLPWNEEMQHYLSIANKAQATFAR
jgi:hypothetical protein